MQKYSLLARNENNFALKNAIIGFFCICRPVLRQLKHEMKMKILLFGNSYQRQSLDGIKSLIGHIVSRGIECCVEREFHDYLVQSLGSCDGVHVLDSDSIPDAHLAISLGGDGTFLTTVMWVSPHHIPILGVNTGHLGYLTACNLANACDMVDDFIDGNYTTERRTMVQVQCDALHIAHPYALNEVAVLRHDTSSMIEMETSLRGLPLTTYKGDGLVISTPTGSTAYNLSAGGPIMAPSAPCLVLTPVSAHSLTMRPIVLPDDAEVSITTHSRSDHYLVSLDGESHPCPTGSTLTITKSPVNVIVVQRRGHNFASTLQQKLHWGQ